MWRPAPSQVASAAGYQERNIKTSETNQENSSADITASKQEEYRGEAEGQWREDTDLN